MKPLQDLGLSSEDVQNAAKHKTAGIYMCVFCVEVVLCCNTRLSRHNRANPLIRGFPGRERTTCCCCSPPPPLTPTPQGAGVPPERIVKVQIDVQAVDEELPVSWVNTHALAEVLKEWDQGGIESVLGNPKFLFTFPPIELMSNVGMY